MSYRWASVGYPMVATPMLLILFMVKVWCSTTAPAMLWLEQRPPSTPSISREAAPIPSSSDVTESSQLIFVSHQFLLTPGNYFRTKKNRRADTYQQPRGRGNYKLIDVKIASVIICIILWGQHWRGLSCSGPYLGIGRHQMTARSRRNEWKWKGSVRLLLTKNLVCSFSSSAVSR